jgi:hypothetical protein
MPLTAQIQYRVGGVRQGGGYAHASQPLVNSMPYLKLDCTPKPMSNSADTSVTGQGGGGDAVSKDDDDDDDDDGNNNDDDDVDAGGVYKRRRENASHSATLVINKPAVQSCIVIVTETCTIMKLSSK